MKTILSFRELVFATIISMLANTALSFRGVARKCLRGPNRLFSTPTRNKLPAISPRSKGTTFASLPEETLYIIDGTAMLFQAYFSNEAKTQDTVYFEQKYLEDLLLQHPTLFRKHDVPSLERMPCNALYVMLLNYARFIRDVSPKYVACAFDASAGSVRREVFPAYKAQRPGTPLALLPQMHLAPKALQAAGVRCFQKAGYEADDLMASLGMVHIVCIVCV
ncbi:hypothetical protein EON64_11580 [archaeon]|nr:MAG: hypothetical protein EON64_11580 [archaeon]